MALPERRAPEIPASETPVSPAAEPTAGPGADRETILLGGTDGTFSDALLSLVLDAITESGAVKARIRAALAESGESFSSYQALLGALHALARRWVREDAEALGFDPFAFFEDLSAYKARINRNIDTYDRGSKANPEAVFWPNPERKPARSVYETLPYIEKIPLVTKETPVASAGSCFAIEIAFNLQRRGFNYIVTEPEADYLKQGIIVDGIQGDNPYAQFSANHGLLFNTPSFRQLAEKAFEVRRPARVLAPTSLGTWDGGRALVYMDPFREDVAFLSREAFEENYEKHLAAVREVLLSAEVFIATPGLNECWEFVPDGSVLSRNPREFDIYPFVRHRTLSVAENVANLQGMIDVVRAHNPNFKLILSLSPVPFLATGRASECHVITANCHSKSVLRVAIEEVVKANRDVFYFPSYEYVTTCTRDPWEADQRHVNAETVGRVMELFDAMFVH